MFLSTSELRVRLGPRNLFKPSSKNIFTDSSKAVLLFGDHLCYVSLVFVLLSCLFIVALWSTAGSRL